MKKINAICSLLLAAVITGHILSVVYLFLTFNYNAAIIKGFAYATEGLVFFHAIVSIILLLFFHEGASLKRYRKLNISTILQRGSCILILVLVHMHTTAFSYIHLGEALSVGRKVFVVLTELLFFGAILTHLAVSFSKALISLGLIRSEKAENIINRIVYGFCGILMLLIIVGIFPLAIKS